MKVSFDGIRRATTATMDDLGVSIQDMLIADKYNDIEDEYKQNVVEKFNEARKMVMGINCLQDDDVVDDLNDLSEELNIIHLEPKKRCERCDELKNIDDFASDDMCNECYECEFE